MASADSAVFTPLATTATFHALDSASLASSASASRASTSHASPASRASRASRASAPPASAPPASAPPASALPASAPPASAPPASALPASAHASLASASPKQAQREARQERTAHVATLLETLVTLVATFTVSVAYSTNPKHMAKITKAAESKKAYFVGKVENLQKAFKEFSVTWQQYRIVRRSIRHYNSGVNWINMLTVQLRKLDDAARDKLTEFERFILSHRFPMYDYTNGFESDADVEKRLHDLMNPVQRQIVSRADGVIFEPSDIPDGLRFLKASQRSVVLATDDDSYFMSCLKTAIETSTTLVKMSSLGTYNFSKVGFFGPYMLMLTFCDVVSEGFRAITLSSASVDIDRRFKTLAEHQEFHKLCKRRIISLLTARDPERQMNEIVVFCQHPGCAHADGFYYQKRNQDNLRIRPECPDFHPFCIRCLQQDHAGVCLDMKEEERALLKELQGVKPCPTCRNIIEKDGGCNHMHCINCDQHFCWTCGLRFSTSVQYYLHSTCRQYDN